MKVFAIFLGMSLAQGFITPPSRSRQPLPRLYATEPSPALDEAKTDDSMSYFTIKTHNSVGQIPKAEWDSLVGPETSPFLEYDWLWCMEESGCASPQTGWNPLHLTVRKQSSEDPDSHEAGEIVAAVPCYVVTHSMGQFIFDNSWAEAAYRMGIKYYPKLLVAVPFTPAGTQRILVKEGLSTPVKTELRRLVGGFLGQVAAQNNISSVHMNYISEEEVDALNDAGYMHRKTMAFQFQNKNNDRNGAPYTSFEDYLSVFKSKRRQKIRKEMQSISESGITLRTYVGADIPDRLFDEDIIYELYTTTVQKMYFGRQYLNSEFYSLLKDSDFRKHLVLILGEDSEGNVVGGTINVVKGDRFYGRYWGAFDYVKNLHFVCCYYAAIEYCIKNGLKIMEAGAGQSDDFKYVRGYLPAVAHSAHFLVDGTLRRMVSDFLDYERIQVDASAEILVEESTVRGHVPPTKQQKDPSPPSARD